MHEYTIHNAMGGGLCVNPRCIRHVFGVCVQWNVHERHELQVALCVSSVYLCLFFCTSTSRHGVRVYLLCVFLHVTAWCVCVCGRSAKEKRIRVVIYGFTVHNARVH